MRYVHDALSGDENLALSLSASTRFHVVVGGGGGFVCVCVCWISCVCVLDFVVRALWFWSCAASNTFCTRRDWTNSTQAPRTVHGLQTDGLLHHSVRAELESATPSAK